VTGTEDADGHGGGNGPDLETAGPPGPEQPATATAAPAAPIETAAWGVPDPAFGPGVPDPAQVWPGGPQDPAFEPPGGQQAPAFGPGVPNPAQVWPGGSQAPAFGTPPPPPRPSRGPGLFGPPPPPRPPHRWGLGAYLLVEATFLLISALLGYVLGGRLASAGAVALALSVPTVCAAGLALLITRIRGNGPRIDLGLWITGRDVAVGVACGLAGLVITIPASLLYVAIVGTDAASAVGDALDAIRAGPVMAVTIFLIVVFLAPLCEEIIYRGLLWGALERLGANRWWTLVVTTIVFALAHFEFTRTPLLLVVAIPIGIARMITGRLPAGVIAHQINNLLPGIVLMLGVLGAVPMT
jgi:membrane protease YdiL (CAAX protease family)